MRFRVGLYHIDGRSVKKEAVNAPNADEAITEFLDNQQEYEFDQLDPQEEGGDMMHYRIELGNVNGRKGYLEASAISHDLPEHLI